MPENPEDGEGSSFTERSGLYHAGRAEARAWDLLAEVHAYLECESDDGYDDGAFAKQAVEIAAIQYRDVLWHAGDGADSDTLAKCGIEFAEGAGSDVARRFFSD